MESVDLGAPSGVGELVAAAQGSDEPITVLDGEDECRVVMRPAVFERILFDSNLLNGADRETLHL